MLGLTAHCCDSDVRQLSQQEQDQGPLDRLEMADRMSVPAELTAATPSIRVMAIAELMSPGFRWWQGMQIHASHVCGAECQLLWHRSEDSSLHPGLY